MSEKFEADTTFLKVDEDLGLVFGWSIICNESGEPYFDQQQDHIPEDAMLKAAADFMSRSRTVKNMHAGEKTGEVVFAWPMTADIAKAMGIQTETTGLMIAIKPNDPETLQKFKDSVWTGFSIGGSRIKDEDA